MIPCYTTIPESPEEALLPDNRQLSSLKEMPLTSAERNLVFYGVDESALTEYLTRVRNYADALERADHALPVGDRRVIWLKNLILCDSKKTAEAMIAYDERMAGKAENENLEWAIELEIVPDNPWMNVCKLTWEQWTAYCTAPGRQEK